MSSSKYLTETFLDQVPNAAAQELQRLPFDDAAALVESVPARLCAPVFHSMIPWSAARILELVTPDRSAAIVRQLDFADSVTLTRLLSPEYRQRLAEALPSRYAQRLRNATEYPLHQVGAWIDPDVPTLKISDTVGDALRLLRDAQNSSHVFLETEDHEKFVGLIAVREIIRADAAAKLAQLPILTSEPVLNRASLESLSFDNRWDDLLHVPVVGRKGNLLGGLSRQSLRHALHEQHNAAGAGSRSVLREVFVAFSVAVEGLVKTITMNAKNGSAYLQGAAGHEHRS